jgi:hypothetical protein
MRKQVIFRNVFARADALVVRAFSGPALPATFVTLYALTYAVQFPLLRWHDVENTSFASITGYRPLAAVALVLTGIALLALCWQMVRVAGILPVRSALPLLLAGWLGASLCALFTFPGQSTDMGDYILRAHMLLHLGRNPLTTPPSQLMSFRDFPYHAWYSEPDYYGPLWHWLSAGAHALAGEDLLANFLAYKGLAIAATGISGLLIYAILARVAPAYRLAGPALWLWNPVTLNEGALHGHNDLVAVPIVLAGLLLVSRGRGVAGLVVLAAAGLVKANLWIFLPVAAVWVLRQHGLRRGAIEVLLGALVGAALVWLAYRPFAGWEQLAVLARRRGWWSASTWTAAIFFALRDGRVLSHAAAVRWIIGGATALFAAIAAVALSRIRDLFLAAWVVVLAYLLVGCHWFQPWYAVWLIAMAAVVPERRVAGYTLIFSFFMLLHPVVLRYVVAGSKWPPGAGHAVMAAATLLVPQALAVYLVVRHGRSAARMRLEVAGYEAKAG